MPFETQAKPVRLRILRRRQTAQAGMPFETQAKPVRLRILRRRQTAQARMPVLPKSFLWHSHSWLCGRKPLRSRDKSSPIAKWSSRIMALRQGKPAQAGMPVPHSNLATLESAAMTFYRRNLPHWHPDGKSIFITWRLYGSLPASMMKKKLTGKNACATRTPLTGRNARATNASAPEEFPGKKFLELDAALDAARRGPCWLADPEFAEYAEYPIVHGAELGRFLLHAYAIMPNHVHILLEPYVPLAKISGPLKGVAACDINASLGRTGKPLWQDESFDHWIRNPAEFERVRSYIEWNPVRAGLVARPEDWKWSSAGSPYFKRLTATAGTATIH